MRVKWGRWRDRLVSVAPEYEDCGRRGRRGRAAAKEVMQLATEAAAARLADDRNSDSGWCTRWTTRRQPEATPMGRAGSRTGSRSHCPKRAPCGGWRPCCATGICTPSARALSVPIWASVSPRARRPSSSWGTSAPATVASAGSAPGGRLALDPLEPENVADAVGRLGLRHVVITSVTRDDLADGGAAHYVATIRAIRSAAPGVTHRGAGARFRRANGEPRRGAGRGA